MLFHLVMIAWMAPTVGAYCSDPLPGSFLLMQGVDLSTLDMNNLNFKRPVIDATCKQGQKKKLGGTLYERPDQVDNWYEHTFGTLKEETRFIESMSDVTKKLNAGVTVEGSYGAVSGSNSMKYKEMQQNIAENTHFYSVLDNKVKTGNMNLQTQPTLGKGAKYVLSLIKKPFKEAPEPYLHFIKIFGTHYFSSGSFGGVIHAEFKINSSLEKRYSSKDLEVQTRIAYNDGVSRASMEVKAGTSTAKAKTDFKNESYRTISYHGGNVNIAKHYSFRDWHPTVVKHPTLLSGNLSPISDLLKDQPKVQEQLELAVDSYFRGGRPATCAHTATSMARQPAIVDWIPVLCDTKTDGGNWIIIQSRTFGNVDFDQKWTQYEGGFGSIHRDHWLGLTNIHNLCNVKHPCEIRFEMVYHGVMFSFQPRTKQPGRLYFEEYSSFYLGNAKDKFRMYVSGPSGTAGDALTYHKRLYPWTANHMQFTTRDQDNDRNPSANCAAMYRGSGWWWNECGAVNLNGPWRATESLEKMQWLSKDGGFDVVDSSEIKVRRK